MPEPASPRRPRISRSATTPDRGEAGNSPPGPGRPARSKAGEVERRILDAAEGLFLTQGFGRTTMDHVVAAARTSKTTLYGRYPTKAELFDAVIQRSCSAVVDHLSTISSEGTPRERLIRVGTELARTALTPEVIALMRVTAAEAETFPDVARRGFDIGFGAHVRALAVVLSRGTGAVPEQEATTTATRFVELALHPVFMHALYGTDLTQLRERVAGDVVAVANLLLDPAAEGLR